METGASVEAPVLSLIRARVQLWSGNYKLTSYMVWLKKKSFKYI